MSNELAYPDGIYQYIYKMCFLHSINIFGGFYYGHKIGGTMGVFLCATSINYWKYPLKSSNRRTIDMIVANICVPYHIYISFFTKDIEHEERMVAMSQFKEEMERDLPE